MTKGPRGTHTTRPVAEFVAPAGGGATDQSRLRARHRQWGLIAATVVLDLAVIALCTMVAARGREWFSGVFTGGELAASIELSAGLIIVTWVGFLAAMEAYSPALQGGGMDEYRRVVNATLGTAGVVGIACYLARYPLSRGFFILLFGVGVPALLIGRYVLRKIVQTARRRGHLQVRVLLSGSPDHVDDVARALHRESWLGYHVVGALTPSGRVGRTPGGVPVLGGTTAASELVDRTRADVMFFAGGSFDSAGDARLAAWDLEHHQDLHIVFSPTLTDVAGERIRIRPVAGLPMVHVERPRSQAAAHWAKRLFDITLASAAIVLTLPLWVLLVVLIKLEDGGPALFRQHRVGRDGRLFWCLKFRSMVPDAEARLQELVSDDTDHVLFKQRRDPRVTRVGRWLRRLSLDELPQLWNIVRGDMSLVGPRPPLPSEVARYDRTIARRLKVRPGLTGLWQVSGRSDLSWDETVRLDLYYVDNWSMVQDLAIMARTVAAVVRGRGAY